MNKGNKSIFIKLAMVIFIISIVMLFIVQFNSAEFYITIFTAILMAIVIIFGIIKIRRDINNEK